MSTSARQPTNQFLVLYNAKPPLYALAPADKKNSSNINGGKCVASPKSMSPCLSLLVPDSWSGPKKNATRVRQNVSFICRRISITTSSSLFSPLIVSCHHYLGPSRKIQRLSRRRVSKRSPFDASNFLGRRFGRHLCYRSTLCSAYCNKTNT
jgi:hypothetical protein